MKASILILFLALVVSAGCKQSDKEQFRQTADTLGQGIKNGIDTLAVKTKAGIDTLQTRMAHADDVNVTIKDDALEVGSMHPGHADLQVKNAGTMPHNLTIVGNGLQQSFAAPLAPNETRTLPIDVSKGSYRFTADAPGGSYAAGKSAPTIAVTVK